MKNLLLLFLLLMGMSNVASAQANVTFCADMSCLPTVTAPSVFGAFNGWSANANILTDQGGGIYCTTVAMPAGAQEYLFFTQEEGAENMDPAADAACTLTTGAFTNRLINVGTTATTVTFGWEDCGTTCTAPPPPPAPAVAAPAPTFVDDGTNVISLFSNVYTDVPVNTWNTVWSNATFADIQIAGDDTKYYSSLDFNGIETTGANSLDLTNMNMLHLDIWTPNAVVVRVKLVDWGADNAFGGGDDTEHEVLINNPTQQAWVPVDISLSAFTGLASVTNISQIILSGVPAGGVDLYVDNFYFYFEPPVEPMVAAPTPIIPASNVISLFSNAYNDVPVQTWNTGWSSNPNGLTDLQVQGNDTKLYENHGFNGVNFDNALAIDASAMNTFHIDIWSENVDVFEMIIVDFGGDGFGGGNDTQHSVFLNLTAETWNSFAIPMSDFASLAGTDNISQFVFVTPNQFGSGKFWIDNVFFSFRPPPVLECRQPTVTTNNAGLCGAVNLVVEDPFILDPTFVGGFTLTNNAPFFYPIGTTTVTYNLTNADGSTSSCTQEVTIEDMDMPVIGPCNTIITSIEPNSCTTIVQVNPEVTDNCGIASISGVGNFSYPVGYHEHAIVATDVNGNVTTHILNIEVHDSHLPTFENCSDTQIVLTSTDGNGVSLPAVSTPTATDNCGVPTLTSDIPSSGLPVGTNTVTFSAEDAYGNISTCVLDVLVQGDNQIISLHPANNIGASANDENAQVVSWNPLSASTQCSFCNETNLEGFSFVGNYWGHQYFLANESSLTHQDAQVIAETYDAHLAVISSYEENNFLKEALGDEVRSAWIGLTPQNINGEWSLVWDNDEASSFNSLDIASSEINENTRVVLSQEGNWVTATNTEEKYFLIERPCVNFTQVSPISAETNELLRSGDTWPTGEYDVTYAVVDMCGNETSMTFGVSVQPEVSEFCTIAGMDNGTWIEKVTFHEMTNTSASNSGYADFTTQTTTMNVGDGVVLLDLKAGGNTAEEVLYWSVWLDNNSDGDFFDEGELLLQQTSEGNSLQANITLAQEDVENARLRIAVGLNNFPEPCGDLYVGEIEDYTVTLTAPVTAEIGRAADVDVYPMPADSYVNLNLSDLAGEEVSIRIISDFGRSMAFEQKVVAADETISMDLRGFKAGVYNIVINSNEHVITKRLIIAESSNTARAIQSRK